MTHPKKYRKGFFAFLYKDVSLKAFFMSLTVTLGFVGVSHLVVATSEPTQATIILAKEEPNFHVKTLTTQFFLDNDAAEMIPVIQCESNFRHHAPDGTILKNHEGSSAIGVAQILSSKHPDPKIIERYNRKFDMDMTVEDFDITTLEGNLGYALALYKVRGTRDWECGKKFNF